MKVIFALISLFILHVKIPDVGGQIIIPVAFVLLAIVWSPKFRKLQIHQSKKQDPSQYHVTMPRSCDSKEDVAKEKPEKIKTARGKAAIILSVWKLILTPLVTLTFFKIYRIVELDDITTALKTITPSNPSFVYFILHVSASFFGYHFAWLACSLSMQRIGYALPLTLATPILIFMTHVTGICDTDSIPLPCRTQDQAYTLSAGALLWLSQFLAITYYVWKSQGQIMAKAHDLFWIPSYNGMSYQVQFFQFSDRD